MLKVSRNIRRHLSIFISITLIGLIVSNAYASSGTLDLSKTQPCPHSLNTDPNPDNHCQDMNLDQVCSCKIACCPIVSVAINPELFASQFQKRNDLHRWLKQSAVIASRPDSPPLRPPRIIS